MDAKAYLHSQGWLGDGHSLDHTGRGIKKPLLVSKKVDALGVGLNKHQAVSDQWWLKAYDSGLRDFGTGKQSLLGQVQKHGVSRGGLYGRFVQGEGVAGTFSSSANNTPVRAHTPAEVEQSALTDTRSTTAMASEGMKRKRNDDEPERKRARQKTTEGPERNRQIKALVLEAQRQGVIPIRPDESFHFAKPGASVSNDLRTIMTVLSASPSYAAAMKKSSEGKEKTQKLARESVKREFKRAARAHLGVDPTAVSEADEVRRRAKKERKVAVQAQKTAEAAKQAAEKAAVRKARNERRQARKEEIRESKANSIPNGVEDDLAGGADEVLLHGVEAKQNPDQTKTAKKYATKGEKRARKTAALAAQRGQTVEEYVLEDSKERAAKEVEERDAIDLRRAGKAGLAVEEYRRMIASGHVLGAATKLSDLTPAQQKASLKRADMRGISVEEYLQQRHARLAAKYARKPAERQVASHVESLGFVVDTQGDIAPQAEALGFVIDTQADVATQTGALSFVIDTQGDDAMTTGGVYIKSGCAISENDYTVARSHIAANEAFTLSGPDGQELMKWHPDDPVPMDPRLWADVDVKTLPKAIRKARREWMAVQRAKFKPASKAGKVKSKGEKKTEAREAMAKKVLIASRMHQAELVRDKEARMEVEGVPGVQVIKMTSRIGGFTKEEMAMGKRVARRVLKSAKKERKADRSKIKNHRRVSRAK